MLETDCLIPVHPVEIVQPETWTLYGIDHAVDVMRQQGYKKWQICQKLRIGDDAWRDAIFEIRKKEAIEEMARGRNLTDEERKRIVMLRQAGAKLAEISAEVGVSLSSVKHVVYGNASQERTEFAQSASAAAVMIMPQTVRGAVTEAVCARIDALTAGISDRLTQIKRMQQEVETYRSQIAELEAWMKEVKKDESHQTDYPSAAD